MDFICFVRLQYSKFNNNNIIFNYFTIILSDDHVRFIKKIRLTRAIRSHTGCCYFSHERAKESDFPPRLRIKNQR